MAWIPVSGHGNDGVRGREVVKRTTTALCILQSIVGIGAMGEISRGGDRPSPATRTPCSCQR